MAEKARKGAGMLATSKMKFEKNMPGRNDASMAICAAMNCVCATVEMSRPTLSATSRNAVVAKISISAEPRKGTWNSSSAKATETPIAMQPSTKFGTTLPIRNSGTLAGVASSASMVPRSHSRATTSAVRSEPIIIRISAIEPGTRKRRLSSSGLNQTRGCGTISPADGAPALKAR